MYHGPASEAKEYFQQLGIDASVRDTFDVCDGL